MESLIFKIRKLRCEYVLNTPVLHLEELDIPCRQLVFVIGKSGIGKSTLIETLGLMNNTIAISADTSVQFTSMDNTQHELRDSWSLSNQALSDFRRKHFSFIFQNTNLMPNFTCGENMMVSLLIKGKAIAEAKREVLQVMDRLSLSKDVFDKKTTEVSGGQRQRLAFVRAITADFSVLFGDEPTGNLDEHTAEELMSVLKELAIEQGKTGIIVSHDLYLAERFADRIIPITLKKQRANAPCGEVIPTHIIHRTENGWTNTIGEPVFQVTQYLQQFLSPILVEP